LQTTREFSSEENAYSGLEEEVARAEKPKGLVQGTIDMLILKTLAA